MNTALFLLTILFTFSIIIISLLLVISTFRKNLPSPKTLLYLPENNRFYSGVYSKYHKPCLSKHSVIMANQNRNKFSEQLTKITQFIFGLFI